MSIDAAPEELPIDEEAVVEMPLRATGIARFFDKTGDDVDDSTKTGIDWNRGANTHHKGAPRTSKDEQALVKMWVDMDIDIGRIDVKALKPLQQAMLTLWSLTTDLKVVKAVKPGIAYMYFTQKHTTISGKKNSFMTALSHERNKKVFGHNPAGEYFLTDEAEKQVESWRVGKAVHINQEDKDGEEDE